MWRSGARLLVNQYVRHRMCTKFHCMLIITKTGLYNFDPLKPHFYIVKLGFTGVYIIFLISAQKHRLWVLVRTASTSTHNLCFEQKHEQYHNFLSENFHFLVVKFSIYSNRRVFVMLLCLQFIWTYSFTSESSHISIQSHRNMWLYVTIK